MQWCGCFGCGRLRLVHSFFDEWHCSDSIIKLLFSAFKRRPIQHQHVYYIGQFWNQFLRNAKHIHNNWHLQTHQFSLSYYKTIELFNQELNRYRTKILQQYQCTTHVHDDDDDELRLGWCVCGAHIPAYLALNAQH